MCAAAEHCTQCKLHDAPQPVASAQNWKVVADAYLKFDGKSVQRARDQHAN